MLDFAPFDAAGKLDAGSLEDLDLDRLRAAFAEKHTEAVNKNLRITSREPSERKWAKDRKSTRLNSSH